MLSYKLSLASNKYLTTIVSMIIFISFTANCAVNVDKSRVVFNSGALTASLSLHNSEKEPALVQLWTDAGDPLATPNSVKTPIIINPPVFKMQPSEVRNIKLLLVSSEELPKDRESLFWLNVYQIPPNTGLISKSYRKIVLPLKLRLKVYVRPETVGDISTSDYAALIITRGGEKIVKVSNPTKWHITIPIMMIGDERIKSFMLSPYSDESFKLSKEIKKNTRVKFYVIDDQGVMISYEHLLN